MTRLPEIVSYAEQLLEADRFTDFPGAFNGLQLENSGHVTRIAAAVDACNHTIVQAVALEADLLVVHHGLCWSDLRPVTGATFRKLRNAIDNNLAIYSSHLPLDSHPTLGNNALLVSALGFPHGHRAFEHEGMPLGFIVETDITREDLTARLAAAVNPQVRLLPFGPERCRRIGIVSGGAGREVGRAAREGIDTFITGEGTHATFSQAEDLGVNLFYAGHYATETFGVKALAAELSRKFDIPWEFIDHPSGL